MKKSLKYFLGLLAILMIVACSPEYTGAIIGGYPVTYELEVPEYAYAGEVITGTLVGSNGSSTTVSITVPSDAVVGEVVTVYYGSYSATLTIAELVDDAAEASDILSSLEGGETVLLRSSTPITLSRFSIDADNVKLIGDGNTTIQLTSTEAISGQSLFAVASDNVVIEGLNFDVTGNTGRANTYNVIKVYGTADSPVSNVTLRDVTINCGNGAAKGINFHFTENAVIENVTVTGTPANDSLAIAESTGLVIRNCNFATGAWGYAVQINWDDNESYINGCNVTFDGIENIPSIYVTDSIWTGSEYKKVPNGHIISGLDEYKAISITTPEKEEGRFFVPAATEAESLEALNYAISIMHERIFNGINGALANVGTAYSWADKSERGSITIKDAPDVDDNSMAMDIELTDFQYSYISREEKTCYTMTGDIQLTLTGTKSDNSFTVTGWEVKSAGLQLEGGSGSAVAAIESIKGGFEPALELQEDNSIWSIKNPKVAKFSTNDLSCRAVFNGKAMVLEGNFPL